MLSTDKKTNTFPMPTDRSRGRRAQTAKNPRSHDKKPLHPPVYSCIIKSDAADVSPRGYAATRDPSSPSGVTKPKSGGNSMSIQFGNRLAQLRKQNGYSQESLAEKLGLSRQAISKWERGVSHS